MTAGGFGALAFLQLGSPAAAGEGFTMSGVGGSLLGIDAYQGVVYAPWSTLSESGFLVRGWAKSFNFSYETDLPGDPKAEIDALGYGVEGEIGWQFTGEAGRIAGFIGAAWQDHLLSPPDPGSSLDKPRVGLVVTIDAEWIVAPGYGVMGNARYLTSFEQYWTQVRPFIDLGGGWKAGVTVAAFGGPGYDSLRAGFFTTGYEFKMIPWKRVFLGGELGVQTDLDGRRTTPYLCVHSGFLF